MHTTNDMRLDDQSMIRPTRRTKTPTATPTNEDEDDNRATLPTNEELSRTFRTPSTKTPRRRAAQPL